MPKSDVEIVVVALRSPLLVGVYSEGELLYKYEEQQKTSEILPSIFRKILQKHDIKRVLFARGPGSFMAIKLVYIFLKTMQIAKGIELRGCDGFVFNDNQPIKAIGNLYFVKENGKIVTKKLQNPPDAPFKLPQNINNIQCGQEIEPLYILPAVKV